MVEGSLGPGPKVREGPLCPLGGFARAVPCDGDWFAPAAAGGCRLDTRLWAEEAQRRDAQIDADPGSSRPADDVFREAWSRIK